MSGGWFVQSSSHTNKAGADVRTLADNDEDYVKLKIFDLSEMRLSYEDRVAQLPMLSGKRQFYWLAFGAA